MENIEEKEGKKDVEMTAEEIMNTIMDAEEEQHEMTDEEREAYVADWNLRNTDLGVMRFEKPTEEELKAVVTEYGEKLNAYNAKTFELADAENAGHVAKFLDKWNSEDLNWEGNMWQGVITFDMIVKKFLEDYAEEKKPFVINYQTLVYLFLALRNMKGTGIKSAIKMQKMNDEFVPILDTIGDLYSDYQEEGKKLQMLQEKWRIMEQGFYIDLKEDDEEGLTEPIVEETAEL